MADSLITLEASIGSESSKLLDQKLMRNIKFDNLGWTVLHDDLGHLCSFRLFFHLERKLFALASVGSIFVCYLGVPPNQHIRNMIHQERAVIPLVLVEIINCIDISEFLPFLRLHIFLIFLIVAAVDDHFKGLIVSDIRLLLSEPVEPLPHVVNDALFTNNIYVVVDVPLVGGVVLLFTRCTVVFTLIVISSLPQWVTFWTQVLELDLFFWLRHLEAGVNHFAPCYGVVQIVLQSKIVSRRYFPPLRHVFLLELRKRVRNLDGLCTLMKWINHISCLANLLLHLLDVLLSRLHPSFELPLAEVLLQVYKILV